MIFKSKIKIHFNPMHGFSNTSLRLNFIYEEGEIQLESWHRINKLYPPSDTIEGYEHQVGWWILLLDEDEDVLYRQIINNPIRFDNEVFSYDGEVVVSWKTTGKSSSMARFFVLIPDLPEAVYISVYGNLEDPDSVLESSKQVYTVELRSGDLEEDLGRISLPRDAGEGRVLGTIKVVDNGPDSERWNLVLLSEGYQETEIGLFHQHCDRFISRLSNFSSFGEVWNLINVHLINVSSIDSGIADPLNPNHNPRTFFDARFHNFSVIDRLIVANQGLARIVANQNVPEFDVLMMIVNTERYGGSGGSVSVFSANSLSAFIGIHEMGHTAFGLADEYEFSGSNGLMGNKYLGPPRSEPNLATSIDFAVQKWGNLIASVDEMPIFRNPDCNNFSPEPPLSLKGKVGAFEGTFHHHCGIFRPESNCIMRSLGHNSFCKVCSERIQKIILGGV